MPRGGLAFYNCGPVSGASQPHKHVQVVPLPLDDPEGSSSAAASDPASGQQGLARPPIWQAVAAAAAAAGVPPGQPFELRNLPYAAFAATLPPLQQEDAAGAQLEATYRQLLARCTAFVEAQTGQQGATPQDGSLSYNWGALPPGGCAAAAQGRSGCCQLHLQVSVSVAAAAHVSLLRLLLRCPARLPPRSVHPRLYACGPPAAGGGGPRQVCMAAGQGASSAGSWHDCDCGCAQPALCCLAHPPTAAATRWRLRAASLCAATRSSSLCGSRGRCTC